MTNPSIAQTINELEQEIRTLETSIATGRADYPRLMLASVRASTQRERDEAKAAALAANERLRGDRVTVEGLQVALDEAKAQQQAERVAQARETARAWLRKGAATLRACDEAAVRAESLVRQAGAAIAEVVLLGRQAHGIFKQYLSLDQAYAIEIDESALAHAVIGELLRAGAMQVGVLEELSSFGLRRLHSWEPLTHFVEHQGKRMKSHFPDELLVDAPSESATRRQRKATAGASE